MQKRILFIIMLTLFLSVFSVGCAQKKEEQSLSVETPKEEFTDALTSSNWEADIMGVSGTVSFDSEGNGTLTLSDGLTEDFTYTLTNISDDGKKADVVISDVDYEGVSDGTVVQTEIVSGGLKVTYMGMSFVLKPDGSVETY